MIDLMSVLAPTGEVLSFASPKESTQRKSDPDAAYSLRSSLLTGGVRSCGARRGITGNANSRIWLK